MIPLLLIGAGCYETEFPVGSADKSSVDPAYAGDFVCTQDNKTVTMFIRTVNEHLYYVEWVDSDGDEPARMVGYVTQINNASFANVRGLTADGSIDKNYFIVRVALSADHNQLTVTNLKEEFFKSKTINSSADVEKIIADNVDNAAMYDGSPITATRLPRPAAQGK
jgi:hypothetical protein